MNKKEFLDKLQTGLAGANPEERVAAMQYYTEYLDEAGPEREAEVLAELGDPANIVASILDGSAEQEGWTPPTPFQSQQPTDPQETANGADSQQQAGPSQQNQTDRPSSCYRNTSNPPPVGTYPPRNQQAGQNSRRSQSNGTTILLICILVLFSPVLVGVAGAAFGVFVSILVALLCVFLIPFVVAIALVPVSVVLIVVASWILPVSVGSALVMIGIGIICLGIGLLSLYGGVVLVAKAIPSVYRWIVWLFNRIFGKGEKANG